MASSAAPNSAFAVTRLREYPGSCGESDSDWNLRGAAMDPFAELAADL